MYGTEDPREDLKSKGVKTRLVTQHTLLCTQYTGFHTNNVALPFYQQGMVHQQHRQGGRSRLDQCHSYDQSMPLAKP